MQSSLREQAQTDLDAISGVNLDEEAANLLRYQQAYQASSKVIVVADELFSTLLEYAAGSHADLVQYAATPMAG